MIIFDFILVITWFPAAVIFHEKYIKCCLPGCTPIGIWTKMRGVCVKKDEYLPKPSKAHFMEEFFGGAFAQFLLSYHKLIVVFFLILTAASTFIWVTLLVPDTKPFTFFNDQHWYSKMNLIHTKKFDYQSVDGKIMVSLSFGLDKSNPWDLNGGQLSNCYREK